MTAGYWLGGLLTGAAVIGAVIWVVLAFFGYQWQTDRYPRLTVPGVVTVRVIDSATRVALMRDGYPPFRLDTGGDDAGYRVAAPTPPAPQPVGAAPVR